MVSLGGGQTAAKMPASATFPATCLIFIYMLHHVSVPMLAILTSKNIKVAAAKAMKLVAWSDVGKDHGCTGSTWWETGFHYSSWIEVK